MRLVDSVKDHKGVSRRGFLGGVGLAGGAAIAGMSSGQSNTAGAGNRETLGFGARVNSPSNNSTHMDSSVNSTLAIRPMNGPRDSGRTTTISMPASTRKTARLSANSTSWPSQ
ncbi:MAG: twin-arginine translocation signal domain-containing protein [Natrialbaceae archaeon]|nr:twin-arginine translocation signal domain-containing protein [Natrialbaceae archaeon]